MPVDMKRAEADLYKEKRAAQQEVYDKVETGEVRCCTKSCENFPDGVCEECVQYVCKEHVHRHPDCDNGR